MKIVPVVQRKVGGVVCVVPNTQQQPPTFASVHLTLITIQSFF
jgi:hypothetical protein